MSEGGIGSIEFAPKTQSKEHKALPPENVAVIRGKSHEGKPGRFSFTAEIGRVQRYPNQEAALVGVQRGEVTEGYHIARGEHAGTLGIRPLEKGKYVTISVEPFHGEPVGKARLELYEYNKARDEEVQLRSAEVDASTFTAHGFDLNQENINNHGTALSPELSQLLYDFQAGQGQFAAEGNNR